MKKWLTGYTTLYTEPNPNSRKVRDLLEKSIVNAMDEVVYYKGAHPFVKVEFTDTKTWTGWVYGGMLEDYVERFPADCVQLDDQTPRRDDFEQYLHYNGARQVNLCGEICAAYCMNVTLTELLGTWQQEQPIVWKRIFKRSGLVAGGTGVPDLVSMFEAAGQSAHSLAEAMRDLFTKRSRYTVEWVKHLVETGAVIASVRIDGSGRLSRSGVLHWVVVTTIEPERCGYGLVTVFNPAPNRIEIYSWREFVESARVPYGVFVPEETQ